ncbi:MAG: DUF5615 family PIN-like protein [Moorella sp. (in: firmicutes)]
MKFLIDVCAGGKLSFWLKEMGYDVADVRSKDCCLTDEEIIDWAIKEQRVIITADKDFGELAIVKGKCNTSIIRLPDVPFEERKKLLTFVLLRHQDDIKKGSLITVTRNRVRVRTLPLGDKVNRE